MACRIPPLFGLAALSLLLPACAPDGAVVRQQSASDASMSWQETASAQWGDGAFEVIRLELPAAARAKDGQAPRGLPDHLRIPLTLDGYPTTLDLTRHSLRADGFGVQTWNDRDGYQPADAPEILTYRGTADGMPDVTVLANFTQDGLRALIVSTLTEDLRLLPARELDDAAPANAYLLGPAQTLDAVDLHCGADALLPPSGVHPPDPGGEPSGQGANRNDHRHGASTGGSVGGNAGNTGTTPDGNVMPPSDPDCVSRAEIAFDCDYQFHLIYGKSVPATVARVEAILNEVDYYYARDVRITMPLTQVIVRTTQFYFPADGGDLLNLFGAEWNTNQTHIPRDMAHLMTNKSGIQYGGLAWVGTVCTSLAYGWSLDSSGIVGHELGHNWGSGHCHDTSPCNNMCGACLYIAPNTRAIIDNFRDSRNCLQQTRYRTPLPPYVSLADEEVFLATELLDGPVWTDPLINDEDGNCDPVQVVEADAQSARGVPLTIVQAPFADGRDRVAYDATAAPLVGLDTFAYQSATKDGLAAGRDVEVTIHPVRQLQGWPLDEGAGTTTTDRIAPARTGTLDGATWTTGFDGNALSFDGTNDEVTLPPLGVRARHLTITLWMKRTGDDGFFPGLLMARGPGAQAGLHLGTHGELRYTWADDFESWIWDSGLITRENVWTFAALVVEPDGATLWMSQGGQLRSAERIAPHVLEDFRTATLHLGHDPDRGADGRYLGALDDVRVFHEALTPAQLERIAQLGGRAEAPSPPDGGAATAGLTELQWLADPHATGHQVYLGTDYFAVAQADPNSTEYLGATTGDTIAIPPLQPGLRYYWRVDTLFPDVEHGRVWQFELPPAHHWPMDETFPNRVADLGAGLDGYARNGPAFGEPGATSKTGLSLKFDGNNDYVDGPPIELYQDRMTIAGWARRNGRQADFAGLVYCRGGNTTAGLHLGDAHDLRYTWNGDGATFNWSSGIKLPNDEWVFVALVVEPHQATIYRGRNGTLTSAVNAVPHAAEEWDADWQFGRDPIGGRNFAGWLDDLRVWRAALSTAEVQAIYDATR